MWVGIPKMVMSSVCVGQKAGASLLIASETRATCSIEREREGALSGWVESVG